MSLINISTTYTQILLSIRKCPTEAIDIETEKQILTKIVKS